MAKQLRDHLPGENPLGIFITPHAVTVRTGSLRLKNIGTEVGETTQEMKIVCTKTFGEAERGTLRNVKAPTMLYGYLCAIRSEERTTRVQIHSSTLRQERERWDKDQLEAYLGSVVSRMSSCEMLMEGGKLRVRPLPRRELRPIVHHYCVKPVIRCSK